MNWTSVFNRLWDLIGTKGSIGYLTGPQFINIIKEIDDGQYDYSIYIDDRVKHDKSTSRRDFFWDILASLTEELRLRAVNAILDSLHNVNSEQISNVRSLLSDPNRVPIPNLSNEIWNSERLSGLVSQIDASIQTNDFGRAISLSYTCLEGFYQAFRIRSLPQEPDPRDIRRLARLIRDYLRHNIPDYPEEAINLINPITNAIDVTRNGFSESHFGVEAQRWLASYVRDLVNTQIRLLLNFM